MSTTSYLDKFRSQLPTAQGNRILSRLVSKRDSGEIRTLDEFKKRLKTLTAELLAERITPTFHLYEAVVGETISSAQWNEMLRLIQDDLETAFEEAENIAEVLEAHHNLIQEVSLKTIRFSLNELDSKISFYEFLARSGAGFDNSLFNTFRESKNISTSRTSQAADILYVDPTSGLSMSTSYDAAVDTIGERLTLGADDSHYAKLIQSEWLDNSYSAKGELTVKFDDAGIKNIIDNTRNTYWVAPILFSTVRTNGAYAEISVRLASTQVINFIEVEPATGYAMELVQVDYFDANGTRRTASSGTTLLTAPAKVFFGRISTDNIILRLRQKNHSEVQFKTRSTDNMFNRARRKQKAPAYIDMGSINTYLRTILSSDFLITDVLHLEDNTGSLVKYQQYLFGIDNVRAGYSTYDSKGIFVSKVHQVNELGQVGLKVIETRPTQESGSAAIQQVTHTYPAATTARESEFHHGVLEYWVAIHSFTEDNYLVSTDIVPILPLSATRIYHEQLKLTRKTSTSATYNDMGSMRFFCDTTEANVRVYRNASELPQGTTGWEFVDQTEDSNITYTTPGEGVPMKQGIKINLSINPLDIYTVSYTPKYSNTFTVPEPGANLMEVIDMTGDYGIRLIPGNILVIEKVRGSFEIARSDVYLIAILRQNSAKDYLTPALEEYMLLTSSRDQEKYIKDYE